jgi:hypothetical protein
LKTFCASNNIRFTRSRPYRKNDNAHVEQKNGFLVRQLVGYERYDRTEQVEWLNSMTRTNRAVTGVSDFPRSACITQSVGSAAFPTRDACLRYAPSGGYVTASTG